MKVAVNEMTGLLAFETKITRRKIITLIVYSIYLLFLGYLLFFAHDFGRIAEGRDFSFNFIPFKEILRYILRADVLGAGPVAVNLLGNIAAFIPMGICLPLLRPGLFGHPYRVAVVGALNSAAVEFIQLVSRVGCCDVDDVILNTFGVVLGYFLVVGFIHRKEPEDAV